MKFYVVATPIGNLQDITLRALDVLRSVDIVVSEDTRVTQKLLTRYDIHKPLIAFHEHSPRKMLEKIFIPLRHKKNIAYVVDAGTPGISDPGSFLVREIRRELPEVSIIPIPGPSALTAAISVAGLESGTFVFLGFPPHKKGRKKFFEQVEAAPYSVVLYESPHRIGKTLQDLCNVGLGSFNAVMLKEISKVYENIVSKKIEYLKDDIQNTNTVKGEFVLVINKNLRSKK